MAKNNEQAFSKLLFTGWILVLLPIIFRVLKYFSPNIDVAGKVDIAFYGVVLLMWIKWLSIIKENFYESFTKLKRDKIIWIVLLVGFILGSKVLGIVVAILLLLKSLILSPLVFAKKFVGDKKDRKKIQIQGIVGAVVFALEILLLSMTFSKESSYANFFRNCVPELTSQGHNLEISTKYCECMFDNKNHDFCVQRAIN